jgi:3'-phosphoadenosine 5'-phosphosulfate sulfotransferase (PAPS reductase)/FAD synthetase
MDTMTEQKVSAAELAARQALDLDLKIALSQEAIRRWYEHWNGNVYVAFSGGMDSTVLVHLVRSVYPEVPAVCSNALLYPEIRDHVRSTPNVTMMRPDKTFEQVIEEYGYPVVSKRNAQYIKEVRNADGWTATKRLRLTGVKSDGTRTKMGMIPKKWQYLCEAPFPISDRCCFWLKKRPSREANERFGYPFLGVRTEEAQQREQTYYLYGCNAFGLNYPRSWPMAFWLDRDIWEYVRAYDLPYAEIYDMGYRRTGCFGCMFGVHLENQPNRFQRMKQTHPRLWDYCIDQLGMGEVLEYIGVPYDDPKQPQLFDVAASGAVLY